MVILPTNPHATHVRVDPRAVVAIEPYVDSTGPVGPSYGVKILLLGPHTIWIKCDDADSQLQCVADIEKVVG